MTKPPILRRLGNKLIATDELVARFDSAGIQLEDLQSRLEATEQISLKLDTGPKRLPANCASNRRYAPWLHNSTIS